MRDRARGLCPLRVAHHPLLPLLLRWLQWLLRRHRIRTQWLTRLRSKPGKSSMNIESDRIREHHDTERRFRCCQSTNLPYCSLLIASCIGPCYPYILTFPLSFHWQQIPIYPLCAVLCCTSHTPLHFPDNNILSVHCFVRLILCCIQCGSLIFLMWIPFTMMIHLYIDFIG